MARSCSSRTRKASDLGKTIRDLDPLAAHEAGHAAIGAFLNLGRMWLLIGDGYAEIKNERECRDPGMTAVLAIAGACGERYAAAGGNVDEVLATMHDMGPRAFVRTKHISDEDLKMVNVLGTEETGEAVAVALECLRRGACFEMLAAGLDHLLRSKAKQIEITALAVAAKQFRVRHSG